MNDSAGPLSKPSNPAAPSIETRGLTRRFRSGAKTITVVNDVSVRDWQYRSTQFLQGKAWEASTPVGPYLITAEPGAPAAFPISCVVDGQVMQDSNTGELCFGPVELVQYISTLITLAPGDLIVTGTPGGVGHARNPKVFLKRGQTVVTRIEGIGECRNVCA